MQTLTMPAPALVFDPPGGPPLIEKPVTVRLPAVRYPDATEVAKDDVRTLGALVYRGTLGSEEVWDEQAKAWKTPPTDASGLAALEPVPLTPAGDGPQPWTGTLVAVGQQDAAGHPRFTTGAPAYRLRAFARAVRDGVEYQGLGGPSPDLQFTSATESQRFGVILDTGNATTAGRARLQLKNGSLQPAGYLEIRATGGQEIEIANCTAGGAVLARVTLSADGDIHLSPAAGRQIVLDARLDAQEITYQPHAGGARQTL